MASQRNRAAWQSSSIVEGHWIAVEAGVKVTEAAPNCCVGLDANPDRDGYVTWMPVSWTSAVTAAA